VRLSNVNNGKEDVFEPVVAGDGKPALALVDKGTPYEALVLLPNSLGHKGALFKTVEKWLTRYRKYVIDGHSRDWTGTPRETVCIDVSTHGSAAHLHNFFLDFVNTLENPSQSSICKSDYPAFMKNPGYLQNKMLEFEAKQGNLSRRRQQAPMFTDMDLRKGQQVDIDKTNRLIEIFSRWRGCETIQLQDAASKTLQSVQLSVHFLALRSSQLYVDKMGYHALHPQRNNFYADMKARTLQEFLDYPWKKKSLRQVPGLLHAIALLQLQEEDTLHKLAETMYTALEKTKLLEGDLDELNILKHYVSKYITQEIGNQYPDWVYRTKTGDFKFDTDGFYDVVMDDDFNMFEKDLTHLTVHESEWQGDTLIINYE